MASILCLAHYCDLHGPTPLMVTQGLPVPCTSCVDDDDRSTISGFSDRERPATSSTVVPPSITDALQKLDIESVRSSSLPLTEQDPKVQHLSAKCGAKSQLANVSTASLSTNTSIETPPASPRNVPEAFATKGAKGISAGLRRDPSAQYSRTYDETVTKRAIPCENCALTLPNRQDKQNKDKAAEAKGPTLRTRKPYARVYGNQSGSDASPPQSHPQSSCASDAEADEGDAQRERCQSKSKDLQKPIFKKRPTTASSRSSVSSRSSGCQPGQANLHTHYLDYTSTHEPSIPATYSIVRASCLRTLSFETLPRRPEHTYNTPSPVSSTLSSPATATPPMSFSQASFPSPTTFNPNPYAVNPFPTSPQGSGGPIFFGDPMAGYTTAYIFRIPDMHARGRKRVYALMALSTHRERLAMKTFAFISAKFRELAAWIQSLAEAEAERAAEGTSPSQSLQGAGFGAGGFGAGRDSGIGLGLGGGSGVGLGGGSSTTVEKESSFLTGGSRSGLVSRMGGSMGPGGFAPKARGLAELVGLPDFFIELHSQFVRLLHELRVVLSS